MTSSPAYGLSRMEHEEVEIKDSENGGKIEKKDGDFHTSFLWLVCIGLRFYFFRGLNF